MRTVRRGTRSGPIAITGGGPAWLALAVIRSRTIASSTIATPAVDRVAELAASGSPR